MNDSKITIEEIARRADVSIATVSRIINHKDNVKPATRQRVLEVMEALKFSPQRPSTLSDSNSKVILMCIPGFDNPFNSPVIDGVQKSAHSQGYDVLILQSRDFYTDSSDYTNILKNNSIAGILILASVPHSELLDELTFRCPVVMCSEYTENYGVSYVSIDDVAAAKKAVNYLISTGRKKIGFMNCNMHFKYARHREKGYLAALKEANAEINPAWTTHLSTINYSQAFSNALHILSLTDRPDAIFACSDVFAVSAINAAKQLGLRVPEDVSVVGFDNIELSTMSRPTITTIEQPCFQLGYQSCELLIEKIKNPNMEDKQIILDTELIVRESTTL
ncbi:LacI family DNA-binding transcriptional regulator [Kineothrix sp. MB12-C1]|uniref:LacI family DNA-binding transcriptional regulator n=1 Tax=Kineothrix sp. MB12-C1 TaxID=3070215 RepID=UPI0027D2325E|nr:LacI family DNA-binding transcriptional regulator [Kineothrix sp. MB12-C1]WMC91124.1 LacI family DNA-binding transcriptional regulator [Kineothrix sp. MB12-C1]